MLKSQGLTKRKATVIVVILAAVLLGLIFPALARRKWKRLRYVHPGGPSGFSAGAGWEIDTGTEEFRTVVVPEKLEGIMSQYNRMQQAQDMTSTSIWERAASSTAISSPITRTATARCSSPCTFRMASSLPATYIPMRSTASCTGSRGYPSSPPQCSAAKNLDGLGPGAPGI